MTDIHKKSSTQKRRVLAPRIFPFSSAAVKTDGPLYYLSWPGWELFIRRKLGFRPAPDAPTPILLPDAIDAETDFRTIDHLNTMAAQMGANFLSLPADSPESLPHIMGNIRAYGAPQSPAPILDDRAWLALWSVSEHQTRQSEELLAQARLAEKKMWAALKGEDFCGGGETDLPGAAPEPDSRAIYASGAWRRLAENILTAEDVIISSEKNIKVYCQPVR